MFGQVAHPRDPATTLRERGAESARAGFSVWSWLTALDALEVLVERYRLPVLLIFCLAIQYTTFRIAAAKPLWADEMMSYEIANRGFAGAWRAIGMGLDSIPPLSFWVLHATHLLFGKTDLMTRLPSLIACWVTTIALYRCVSRRTTALIGLMAALLLCFTPALRFAWDARPYSPALMFTTLAFSFWQSVKDGNHRRLNLSLFALSFMSAIWCHYYAVFAAVPFLGGELVEFRRNGKWDFPAVAAIVGTPVVSIAPLVPLMVSARQYYVATFWSPVEMSGLRYTYVELFGGLAFPLAAALFTCIPLYFIIPGFRVKAERTGSVPPCELAAAVLFLTYPPVSFVVAALATHAFFYRYVLPTCLGAIVPFAFLLHILRKHRRQIPIVAALVIVACSVELLWWTGHHFNDPTNVSGTCATSRRIASESTEPLVLGVQQYLSSYYYGSAAVRGQIYYTRMPLKDLEAVPESRTFEISLLALSRDVPLHVPPYREFTAGHPSFYLYMPDEWMIGRMLRDGAEVRTVGYQSGHPLYHVNFPRV